MKRSSISILIGAIITAVGLCLWCASRQPRRSTETVEYIHRDTVRIFTRDTVTVVAPRLAVTPLPRYVIARLERTDTTHDTVEVRVPLSRYEYADSNVSVIASGFAVTFDSVRVYAPVEIRTVTVTQRHTRRWAVGPSLSVGIDPRGHPTVAIGVGVTYNLLK